VLASTSTRNTVAPWTWSPSPQPQLPQQTPQDLGSYAVYEVKESQAQPPLVYELFSVARPHPRVVSNFPPQPYLQEPNVFSGRWVRVCGGRMTTASFFPKPT